MKKFEVRIYFSGYITKTIESMNEPEAIEQARAEINLSTPDDIGQINETLEAWPDADTAEEIETEDDEPNLKHYEFKVILGACGNTPEEAWADVCEGVAVDGLGAFEPDSVITEEDMEL